MYSFGKGNACPLGKVIDADEDILTLRAAYARDVNLIIALALQTPGIGWKNALFVAHQMSALSE